ncbi:glycosyltransferase family 4 protein [Phyllobacterium leguminum]|uniref:Glycosyltransferase involved in cell wall biosynthesis n=1 Tax=Phyllobacterium leguminum TaxID=314237 RepID=A0A318T4N0_9HYPH|nr:glycosyltransferase family 1 protein [Phyllobacterium leguminum]PYE89970.1 glycosyltransferase involved in cell wall biosynthesis [Phyllobacterium leguminum]
MKPRLVIVTDAWHPQVNGVVRTLTHMRDLMSARGYAVTIVSPSDYRSVPCPTYPEIRLALTHPAAVRAVLAKLQPAYVHIATEGPLGIMARRACLRNGWHFTTSFHTRFPEYLSERFPVVPLSLTYGFLRRFHNAAACTLVPTPSIRDELAARGFTHLKVWTRGVDRALFKPKRVDLKLKHPIFLCVGRVAPEKNLAAFLSLDLPGTKLVVGDGPSLAELKARFPEAVFVGKKEGKELARYYAGSDVFVFPSRTDTFGLVLLEAIASGLPVAAYPVPGSQDVVGATGAGVLSEDLGEACREALKMGRIDPDTALKDFTWEHCADIFEGVLTPVVADEQAKAA